LSLSKTAGKTQKKSHVTYFWEAIRIALNRSTDTHSFLKFLEEGIELNFLGKYGDAFPSQTAFDALFNDLKQRGTLPYMPRLHELAQQLPKVQDEESEEEEAE
jgi:hypothetical protein